MSSAPTVSVILPTYNREAFLPQALTSISNQTFTDWELIVVDDGSTDGSRELLERLLAEIPQPTRYVYQDNGGPYAARNTGLDYVRGQYIAFDSDDEWLPHHLNDCVTAMNAHEDVDLVYGPCRIVDDTSGNVIHENTFYMEGRPHPLLALATEKRGTLNVFTDDGLLRCQLLYGLYVGLQNCVLRSELLRTHRFQTKYRSETEDTLFIIRAIVEGAKLAYFDRPHVIYHVHGGHSSAAGSPDVEKSINVFRQAYAAATDLEGKLELSWRDRQTFQYSRSRMLFWILGYSLYWQHGRRKEALECYRQALRLWPWSTQYWKTYLLALVRKSPAYSQRAVTGSNESPGKDVTTYVDEPAHAGVVESDSPQADS